MTDWVDSPPILHPKGTMRKGSKKILLRVLLEGVNSLEDPARAPSPTLREGGNQHGPLTS